MKYVGYIIGLPLLGIALVISSFMYLILTIRDFIVGGDK